MTKKTVAIVGGGTAGLTIANNLQDHFRVVVIEKSPYKQYPFNYGIPLLIGLLYRKKVLKYISKRELTLINGRHIPFFESNVIGGASAINGCVHTVGSMSAWNRILNAFDSSYSELMESYEKLYSTNRSEGHKINLTLAPQNMIDKAFIQTLNSLHVPVGDMNFSNEENCGSIYDTTRGIFRSSVLSLISKKEFGIFRNEIVEKVVFDKSNAAVGVETSKRAISADHVILCGGVIGTCNLLLRAAREEPTNCLKSLRIGHDIQDHTNLRVNVITNTEIGSLNEVFRSLPKKWSLLAKHLLGKPTLMVGTGATSGAHLDLDGDGEVDTRIQVVQFSETGRHGSDGKFFLDKPGFSFSITPIHPASRGLIELAGEDVTINPRFLSDHRDMEILRLALDYCLKLLRSTPLSSFVQEIVSKEIIETDPDKYINDNIYSGHHLLGGTHNAIDKDFKIKGTNGLYVCDASIFDRYAASNIHSSVVLMSDIFSKRFIERNSS